MQRTNEPPMPATDPELLANLRQRAEEKLQSMPPDDLSALSPEEFARLVRELRLHQIELEMQNEELQRVVQELEATRARYFDLFHLAPVGYVTLSQRDQIVEANSTVAQLLATIVTDLVGKRLTKFILPEDQDTYYFLSRRLEETGQPQSSELRLRRADGAAVWVQLDVASVVESSDGTGIRRVTLTDITDRKRAEEELSASRQRLATLSRQLIGAQEAERRALARELHDELGQVLTLVKMNIQAAQRTASSGGKERLEAALQVAEQAIAQVRNLSLNLRPSVLDDFGLAAALEWYVSRCTKEEVVVELQGNLGAERLPAEIETACFRIVQEAVTNALRHARAKRIQVRAGRTGDVLEVSVRDDGAGFDLAAARQRAAHGGSTGLLNMEERARLLGGDFRITTAPGRGVEVWASFPLAKMNRS